jgi:peptide/nickel transport system permease protein
MSDLDSSLTASSVSARSFFRRYRRNRLGMGSLLVLLAVCLACAAAPLLTSGGPLQQNLGSVMQLPSAQHWLGTDLLGRDVFTRLLYGGRGALIGTLEALVVHTVLGVLFGLWAGYAGGSADRVISGAVDILMSLPGIVVMLVVLALFDQSLPAAMITLGGMASGGMIRVVRASTVSVREELYVAAARVSGLGPVRILLRHILPRATGPIIVNSAVFGALALAVQTGLGFLNLGVRPPAPSWGGMVGEASQAIQQFPWLLVPSGGTIALVILTFGLIGDAARDANAESKSRGGRPAKARATPRERPATAEAGPPSDALLDIRGLRIEFETGGQPQEVVHGVSLEIGRGELVALVGESGSGKTAIALSVLGLLPGNGRAVADRFRYEDIDLSFADDRLFRTVRGSGIAMISQEPMRALDPAFTVGSQLGEVVRVHRGSESREARRMAVLELLAAVRLPDPKETVRRYPHQLSGGMAQRVAIAMALAGDPRLLIADEPTTALDVTVQAEILDLLRSLRSERGMSILLITHDLAVVADLCERAVVMRDGKIVERQDVLPLFASPQHQYTASLLAATPNLLEEIG